jgi:hypothetical protein
LTTTATHQEVRCRVRTMMGSLESNRSVTPGESPWAFSESQQKVGSWPGMHLAHTRRN